MIAFGVLGARAVLSAPANFPAQPYPEVRYEYKTSADPVEQIYIVRVDLSDPDVDVRVSAGGPDPDGTDTYQTTLQTPSVIAGREHFEVAVNGDFFVARQTVDAEGTRSGYVTGKWASVDGPAVTDGILWAPAASPRAVLMLDSHKKPSIAVVQDVPPDAMQVIAGSNVLVKNGKTIVETQSSLSRTRHPRTAAGIADGGKTLVLVVVDGRRAGEAAGMSLTELADLMRQQGCSDALNLDGGGSSELLVRDPQSGELTVMNRPSDGRERAVANVLGVSIRGSRRALPPVPPVPVTPTIPTPTQQTPAAP